MTYLIDSNILIYAANAQSDSEKSYQFLSSLSSFYYSSVTRIEVMGYHDLDSEDKEILESLFMSGKEIPLSQQIRDKAIDLKQEQKMSLGDSIIAASALVGKLELVTRNIDDFSHIKEIQLLNPYTQKTRDSITREN